MLTIDSTGKGFRGLVMDSNAADDNVSDNQLYRHHTGVVVLHGTILEQVELLLDCTTTAADAGQAGSVAISSSIEAHVCQVKVVGVEASEECRVSSPIVAVEDPFSSNFVFLAAESCDDDTSDDNDNLESVIQGGRVVN